MKIHLHVFIECCLAFWSVLSAPTYLPRCYCPQIDPLLKTDAKLQSELLRHRRQEVQNLPVYVPPVVPDPGVPPANVLQYIDPSLSDDDITAMTNETYHVLKAEIAAAKTQRDANIQAQTRRKREASRIKRSLGDPGEFKSLLSHPDYVYGIFTTDGELDNPTVCECDKPTSKIRIVMRAYATWDDTMEDLTSTAFKAFKLATEERLDGVYGTNPILLEDGYGGTTVVAIRLVQLGHGTPDPANNITDVDLVEFEIEIPFIGTGENDPAPRSLVDSFAPDTLGIVSAEASSFAFCLGDMRNFNPPTFLQTDVTSTDRIPSRTTFYYECVDSNAMLPFNKDLDSNFRFEVSCERGQITRPTWPDSCVPEVTCRAVPSPPSGATIRLNRLDDRSRFRVGQFAYFGCSNSKAVLNDGSGLNVYELPCIEDDGQGRWDINWPECVLEPTCSNLPDPPSNTNLRRATQGSEVKLGENVVYECTERDKYHETSQGPELTQLCGEPVGSNNKGTLTAINWLTCDPLPCVCLGQGNGLTPIQAKSVLLTACNSTDNFVLHSSPGHQAFMIPKRVNCGTFKPDAPTAHSKCECTNLPEPKILWAQMEIMTFTWSDDLLDGDSPLSQQLKEEAEQAMNNVYLNDDYMMPYGFLRVIVAEFEKGTQKTADPDPTYRVKVKVEMQFKGDSNITAAELSDGHPDVIQQLNAGRFSPEVQVVPSAIVISDIHVCPNSGLTSLQIPEYVLAGSNETIGVGQSVNVNCGLAFQLFTQDIWDMDDSDNTLTITCKPDGKFNIPLELPACKAKCNGTKPVPPAENNLILDTTRTSATEPVWQGEMIWYTCKNDLDGIQTVGPTGELEGSDVKSASYSCDQNGNYAIPTVEDQETFEKCLPRPRRCQCLGDFATPDLSRQALDMFCRNESFTTVESTARDPVTRQYLPQIMPSKKRCGSLDAVAMTPETKCYCHPKEKNGADEGIWINFELFNLPFHDEFLDLTSSETADAIFIVQKAFDELYLNTSGIFTSGFVRTIVTRFAKGTTDLQLMRQSRMDETNATTVDDLDVPGDPIIDLFETSEEEIEAAKAAAAAAGNDYVAEKEYSTIVYLEVQFVERAAIFAGTLKDITLDLINSEWVDNTLWVNPNCFTGNELCRAEPAGRCANNMLDRIFNFDFTHSNVPGPGEDEVTVPVGSAVNMYCAYPNERITEDEFDDDPKDYKITISCKPNLQFDFPDTGFPDCRVWCPGAKPIPPPETGLTIIPEDDNNDEYWEDATVTYICNDTSLGVDASDSYTKSYKCVPGDIDEPTGRFTVPRAELNQTWPICTKQTTTVAAPILDGFKQVLRQSDAALIEEKTRELYLSERNDGDSNMYLTVLLPCLLVLLVVALIILCCTRIDNPLCKYCMRNYSELF